MLNRALFFKNFGDPGKVLELKTKALPKPKSDEVVVRMSARSVNPSDLLSIKGIGHYRDSIKLPAIPGFEGVGKIFAKGENVTSLTIGQRVLALRGEGTWQEYVTVPAEEVVPVPDQLPDEKAAQLYINPLTAWLIIKKYQIGKNDIVVANAAGSAMGKLFAQFSKHFGYKYIAVTRSDKYSEYLFKLGATAVINSNEGNLLSSILKYTAGKRPNIALEAVGGQNGIKLGETLIENGKLISYGNLSLEPYPANYSANLMSGVTLEYFWLRDFVYNNTASKRLTIFKEMIQFILDHEIELPVANTFDLTRFHEAIALVETPNRSGKVLLTSEIDSMPSASIPKSIL